MVNEQNKVLGQTPGYRKQESVDDLFSDNGEYGVPEMGGLNEDLLFAAYFESESEVTDSGESSMDDDDENCCAICIDAPKTHMCYPCGHRCICEACAALGIKTCPICRKGVENIIKVFG